MSPSDFEKFREPFGRAISVLAWTRREVERQHEREWDRSRTVAIICDSEGRRMIDESDLSEEFVKEIIRIADLLASQDELIETAEVRRDWTGKPYLFAPERGDR